MYISADSCFEASAHSWLLRILFAAQDLWVLKLEQRWTAKSPLSDSSDLCFKACNPSCCTQPFGPISGVNNHSMKCSCLEQCSCTVIFRGHLVDDIRARCFFLPRSGCIGRVVEVWSVGPGRSRPGRSRAVGSVGRLKPRALNPKL